MSESEYAKRGLLPNMAGQQALKEEKLQERIRELLDTLEQQEAENERLRAALEWQPIETLKVGGDAVLLYAECWVDPDFNPTGIREGFRNESDTGPIFSAKWNDCHDCWDTVVNYEATRWKPRPEPPKEESQ